jgi:L-iditol 2-dehydrogenase
MRLVTTTDNGTVEIREAPTPTPRANYALVRITSSPMCTEWHSYRNAKAQNAFGHEAAGVVEAVGPAARHVAVGDRVVVMPQNPCGKCHLCLAGNYIHCRTPVDPRAINDYEHGRATFATHCLQQDWMLMPVPDAIPDDHAAMACCGLGPTFNAMQLMDVRAYDTVLVGGLGPVGLGGVVNATHLGAHVIGLDINPYRMKLATKLGAEAVIDPTEDGAAEKLLDLTGGGADKAVETSNVPSSPPFLAEALKCKGCLALVSWSGELSVPRIVGKGLSIHGAWHWNHLKDAPRMLDVIRRNAAKLDTMITHTFTLDDVEAAWQLQATGQCGKVVLHP